MIKVLYITHEVDAVLGSSHSLANLVHSVKNEVEPIILFPKDGVAYSFFKQKGYKCIIVPFKLNIASKRHKWIKYIPRTIVDYWVNKKALQTLERIVQEEEIQLIHSNTSVLTLGYLLAKRLKLKHIWHLREFQNLDFGFEPFCGWTKLKRMISQSDATIAITEAIKSHFISRGNETCMVLNDAVRSTKEICYEEKEKYFLFCGKVCQAKGANLALEIFSEFCKKDKTYQLFFLGTVSDTYKLQLTQNAKALGINDKIKFLGYQKDIKTVIKKATSLLMCSRNEAQGRVTVEAMFYGVPVIGYNSGGTKEIIKHGENGFLFSSALEAANLMLDLLNNQPLVEHVVKKGHETASDRFSEEKYGEQIIKIYQEILKN